MNPLDEALLRGTLTEQEHNIAQRLLAQGMTPEDVLEALKSIGTPPPSISDDEVRTIRYEALGDGSIRRID